MDTELDTQLRAELDRRRGDWPRISKAADVSHSWVSQFVRGKIPNPGYATLKRLQAALAKPSTQRFNLDDLEGYIQSTGDVDSVIEYLAAKYKDSDEQRKARTLAKVESMLPELVALLGTLKGVA